MSTISNADRIVLVSLNVGAALEALTAKGYTYSQIASSIKSLEKRGLIALTRETGIGVTPEGKKLLEVQKPGKERSNIFIAPAISRRIKKIDNDFFYVPNRKSSSFFREQEN
jgi:hypothetical protein